MEEVTTGVIIVTVDMMITEDRMVAAEEMIIPTPLIDMKTNATTIAIVDGMMMRGDIITMITTTIEAAVVEDDEDHHLLPPLDYPNQKFHRHSLAPIAN